MAVKSEQRRKRNEPEPATNPRRKNPEPTVDLDALARKVAAGLRPTVRQMAREVEEEEAVENPGTDLSLKALEQLHAAHRKGMLDADVMDELCDGGPECPDAEEDED
jgi:hypothetical protein